VKYLLLASLLTACNWGLVDHDEKSDAYYRIDLGVSDSLMVENDSAIVENDTSKYPDLKPIAPR
jgi:hypothetical protein